MAETISPLPFMEVMHFCCSGSLKLLIHYFAIPTPTGNRDSNQHCTPMSGTCSPAVPCCRKRSLGKGGKLKFEKITMSVLSSHLTSLLQSTDMEEKRQGQLLIKNVKPEIGLANGDSVRGLQLSEESKW